MMVGIFHGACRADSMEVMRALLPSTLAMAAICTVLYFFSSHACNPGMPWWRNRGLMTDAWYWLVIPFMAPFIRHDAAVRDRVVRSAVRDPAAAQRLHQQRLRPVRKIRFLGPGDALSRGVGFPAVLDSSHFPRRSSCGRFHAIHHSAEDVDWTTAYRFHPVNLMLGPFLVDVLMLYVGVSPKVLICRWRRCRP